MQSPEHYVGHAIAGQTGPVQHAGAALVELSSADPSAELPLAPCSFVQVEPCERQLRGPVDCNEQAELSLLCSNIDNVDVVVSIAWSAKRPLR